MSPTKSGISLLMILPLTAFFLLSNCQSPSVKTHADAHHTLQTGMWRAELSLGQVVLPFTFKLSKIDGEFSMTIFNAAETVEVSDIERKRDSLLIRLPVFDSEIKAFIANEGRIEGRWHDHSRTIDYFIPFVATAGDSPRFETKQPSKFNVTGRWEVTFSPDSASQYPAIGEFRQNGNDATGTFITETGDYRYLEGVVSGAQMHLSCFDGAHAFLFQATMEDSATLSGTFYSGKHWKEPWTAKRNDSFELRDPDALTYLKPAYDGIDFSFPNLEGQLVSLNDEKFRNKAVIVQIMGSWCPNCMDETRLYADLYDRWNDEGLEIIALAFERSDSFDKSVKNVLKFKTGTKARYEFLIAGKANKEAAAKALPMLNHVMSYPTSIFIDPTGTIRKIHTGFYGPGTESYYIEYQDSVETLIRNMLKERE